MKKVVIISGSTRHGSNSHIMAETVRGWTDCFPGVVLKGVLEAVGLNMAGDVIGSTWPEECRAMGRGV